MTLTDEHMDMLATALIPILDKAGDMAEDKNPPAYVFVDQPESKPGYEPPSQEDLGFAKPGDTGGFTLPGDERLTWAIQGQAVMVTSIPEPRSDGSYRIVLSSSENWVLKSVLMSGLDLATEIELILAPRI